MRDRAAATLALGAEVDAPAPLAEASPSSAGAAASSLLMGMLE